MNAQELASKLNNINYPPRLPEDLTKAAAEKTPLEQALCDSIARLEAENERLELRSEAIQALRNALTMQNSARDPLNTKPVLSRPVVRN